MENEEKEIKEKIVNEETTNEAEEEKNILENEDNVVSNEKSIEENSDSDESNSSFKQKNNNPLIIFLIILILVVLGICGYFVYDKLINKASDKTSDNNKTMIPTTTKVEEPTTTTKVNEDDINNTKNSSNIKIVDNVDFTYELKAGEMFINFYPIEYDIQIDGDRIKINGYIRKTSIEEELDSWGEKYYIGVGTNYYVGLSPDKSSTIYFSNLFFNDEKIYNEIISLGENTYVSIDGKYDNGVLSDIKIVKQYIGDVNDNCDKVANRCEVSIEDVSIENNYELVCTSLATNFYSKDYLNQVNYNGNFKNGYSQTLSDIYRFYSDNQCYHVTEYITQYMNNDDLLQVLNKNIDSTRRGIEVDDVNLIVKTSVGLEYGTGDGHEMYCNDWKFATTEELKELIENEITNREQNNNWRGPDDKYKCKLYIKK